MLVRRVQVPKVRALRGVTWEGVSEGCGLATREEEEEEGGR
jgi:hypothetical protein